MVFRSRRSNATRPIHRIKHVVDSQFGLAIATDVTTVLINSVDAPVLANTGEVETGSTVNGIFLNVEVVSTSETGVLPNVYFMIFKNPGGNLTFPAPNAVGSNDNKKYVFHQEMAMLDSESTTHVPRVLFKGVIVIPRGYRRMAINDQIAIRVRSQGTTANACIQAHYKEFR